MSELIQKKGKVLIEAGYIYANYIPLNNAYNEAKKLYGEGVGGFNNHYLALIRDYNIQRHPGLLEKASTILLREIKLRIELILKNHC